MSCVLSILGLFGVLILLVWLVCRLVLGIWFEVIVWIGLIMFCGCLISDSSVLFDFEFGGLCFVFGLRFVLGICVCMDWFV